MTTVRVVIIAVLLLALYARPGAAERATRQDRRSISELAELRFHFHPVYARRCELTGDGIGTLPYQVEEWDAAIGSASIWVRVPTIKGNARQEIKLHWGKADAVSESSGAAVFNESNGYLSVWHMNDPVKDEVGTLESKDVATTATAGMIGKARHLAGKQGIFCGDKITNYPAGFSPHSTEAWFRAEQPNATIIAWGNEQAQGKVVVQFVSPPHIRTDCYFSNGNVDSASLLAASEWVHFVHSYQNGDARIYGNGSLDGKNSSKGSPLA